MDIDSPVLVIGEGDGKRLMIQPLYRERPASTDYDDGNWVITDIRLEVGGFRGHVQASLCAQDFTTFATDIRRLFTTLSGQARFRTMEEWLSLDLVGDGKGHFETTGKLVDSPGVGNRLHFSLSFDQTALSGMLRSLDQIAHRFPIVGDSQR